MCVTDLDRPRNTMSLSEYESGIVSYSHDPSEAGSAMSESLPPDCNLTTSRTVDELMDEIQRLNLLIDRHEQRFTSLEAKMKENSMVVATTTSSAAAAAAATAAAFHHQRPVLKAELAKKVTLPNRVMSLVFSPLRALDVFNKDLPSPFVYVTPNRLLSLTPFRAVSTLSTRSKSLILSPISSISSISSSFLSSLSTNPKSK